MKNKIFVLIVFSAVMAVNTGCSHFHLRLVNVEKGANDNLKKINSEHIRENKKEAVHVTIVMNGQFGCYLEAVKDVIEREEKGRYRCEAFTVDPARPRPEVIEKKDSDGIKAAEGLYFANFSNVLQKSLEAYLTEYYENVEVSVSETPGIDGININPNLLYYQCTWRTADKVTFVELDINYVLAGLTHNAAGYASHKIGNGHLGWLIPLGVLTFPVGFLIGSIIFDNLEQKKMAESVADAINEAAKNAAETIAKHNSH